MTAKPDDTAVLRVSITAAEAMSGTTRKILVPTEGSPRELTMRIPPSAPNNALLRLAGQGPDGADVFVRLAVASGNAPTRTAHRWIPVLAVLVTIGAILALTLLKPADSKQSATSGTTSNTPTTEPTTSTTNTSTPETTTSSYAPSTTDAVPPVDPTSTGVEAAPEDAVGVGGCLQNQGTATSPHMVPAACASGLFKVLARNTGTTLSTSCDGVSGTTHSYVVEKYTVHYRNGIETGRIPNVAESYVLCLRQL